MTRHDTPVTTRRVATHDTERRIQNTKHRDAHMSLLHATLHASALQHPASCHQPRHNELHHDVKSASAAPQRRHERDQPCVAFPVFGVLHTSVGGWDFNLDMHKTDAKGGTRMAFLGTQYVVKELSGADHKSLLAITQSYGSHIRSGETLLCPIYLHFKDTLSGRFFMVCRNCVGAGLTAQVLH